MKISPSDLKSITNDILTLFQNDFSFKDMIKMKDYHGFTKGRIPEKKLEEISLAYHVPSTQLQAELVSVEKDLSDEIHIHKHAHAYCIILGKTENFPNAKNAFAFVRNKWFPICSGDIVDIPPHTKHGFTIQSNGILYFLSVQTPPIENDEGHDDYYKVENVPKLV